MTELTNAVDCLVTVLCCGKQKFQNRYLVGTYYVGTCEHIVSISGYISSNYTKYMYLLRT